MSSRSGAAVGISEVVGDVAMCVVPRDFGKLVLSVEVLPGSGPWRFFGLPS